MESGFPAVALSHAQDGHIRSVTHHGIVLLHDGADGRVTQCTALAHGQPYCMCASFSSRGDVLATVDDANVVCVWALAHDAAPTLLYGENMDATCCACSPDGRIVAFGMHGDGILRFVDVATGTMTETDVGDAGRAFGLVDCAFSADGRAVVAASANTLRIWRVRTRQHLWSAQLPRVSLRCCALVPCSRLVATTSHDNRLRLWTIDEPRQVHVLGACNSGFDASPDGAYIAAVYWGSLHMCTLTVWNTRTRCAVWSASGIPDSMQCLFSHDSLHLWTSAPDGRMHRHPMPASTRASMLVLVRYGMPRGRPRLPSELWGFIHDEFLA
jgi:WD40 repeat protein